MTNYYAKQKIRLINMDSVVDLADQITIFQL